MVDNITGKLKATSEKMKDFSDKALKVGTAFTAIGGVITGVSVKAVSDFSEVGDAIEKMATRTGLGAEAVSALRVAADASGTSIETVEAGIKKMELTMTSASSISDTMAGALDGIGVSVDQIIAMTPEQQFEAFAQAIGAVENPATKTQLAVEAFGKAGAELIPMFEDGNFSMEQWKTQAASMGVLMSDEVAGKAADLNDAMGYLTTTVNGLWLQVASFLAPVFTDLAQKLQPIINKVTDWMKQNPKLTQILALFVLGIGALLVILGPLLIALSALPAILAGIGVAMTIATGPVGIIVAAIAGLIAVGVLLYTHWDTIKEKAGEIFGSIASIITGAFSAVNSAITGSINFVIARVNDFIHTFNGMGDKLQAIPGVNIPNIPDIPFLAKGGIVTSPTLAMIGEAGPEAVVPLNQMGSVMNDNSVKKDMTVNIYGAGQSAEEILSQLNTMYKLA